VRNDPEEKEKLKRKRARSFKTSQRDKKHHCRVGAVITINNIHYLVGITTSLFIYLIKQNGDYEKLSWKKWDEIKPYAESSAIYIDWTRKVRESVSFLKKKIKFERKIRKKIKREPVIKRTPVKIKKKKGRGRIKKWR